LEERHWIDKQTESVYVALLLYNGQKEAAMIVCRRVVLSRTGPS
jgi:hypothetical protein